MSADILDDPVWVEWRGGRAHDYEAAYIAPGGTGSGRYRPVVSEKWTSSAVVTRAAMLRSIIRRAASARSWWI
ncbi:hypothetical protein SAMN05446589_1476 [Streptomyces sp. OV198]|nr:hypothetical protein SAMN05446589_1476 [Streptomyces sp. OV198]